MADSTSLISFWQRLDRLRAVYKISDTEFSSGLAALIFLRWVDFEDAEREAIAAFDEVEYESVLPSRLHWRSWCHFHDPTELKSIFEELQRTLDRLGNSHHDAIVTQLHRVAPAIDTLTRFNPNFLAQLVQWLYDQSFETPDDRRSLRDQIDTVFAGMEELRHHWTPFPIKRLLIDLASPQPGDRVYDPCMGSAGLLTWVHDALAIFGAGSEFMKRGQSPLSLYGVELNETTYIIALCRLVLSGVSAPQIELGNALERPPLNNPEKEGYDVVLTNPPWGMKIDLYGLNHYPIQTKDSTSLFLQHAISQLRPGGRCVMVVPPSLLFRTGREQQLREWLLRENTVEAVVSLPRGLFAPHTSIQACLLMFRRGGATRTVRMVDAESDSEKTKEDKNTPAQHLMVAQVGQLVRSPVPKGESWDITLEELAEIGYDLSPKRRDRSGLELILDSLPKEAEIRLLKHCCSIATGRTISSSDLQDSQPFTLESKGSTLSETKLTLKELDVRIKDLQIQIDKIDKGEQADDKATHERPHRDALLTKLSELQRQVILHVAEVSESAPHVPYVRIRDVDKGVAARGSAWLRPLVAASIEPNWRLRAGDILLSKSGTIGKAGIVRNGAVGGIAASGFFVLRVKEDTIDLNYLLAYLRSTEVTAWMEDRARGVAAKHLSVAVIKELPVALPPLQIQQRIAEQHRKFGVDALTHLAELLSEDDSQSLASELNDWVSRHLKTVESYDGSWANQSVLALLEDIADSECPVNVCKECNNPYHLNYDSDYLNPPNDYASGIREYCLACWLGVGPSSGSLEGLMEQNPLVGWALDFRRAVRPLSGVSKIPDPASLISVLQSTEVKLWQSTHRIEGHLPNQERAKRLTIRVINIIDSFTKHLVTETKIVVNVLNAVEYDNGQYRVELTAENKGRVPLRDVRFSLDPPMTAVLPADIAFLPPGILIQLIFEGRNQWYSDDPATALRWSSPEWSLNWTAQNLAGTMIEEKRELGIEFNGPNTKPSPSAELPTDPLRSSPYVTGSPIKVERGDVFVGREQLLEDIRHQIAHSGNVILLEGNRRAGKSSILWHLEGCDSIPGWIGVYHSFQGTEGDSQEKAKGVPTVEVFRGIANDMAKSIQSNLGEVLLPDGSMLPKGKPGVVDIVRNSLKSDAPFTYFREYVEQLLNWLQLRNLRLLLLLDEFDKLQEGIDSGITSPQVPENLRFLLQSNSRLTAILTSMKRLRRVREEYFSALYGLGTPFDVTSLSQDDAEKLVTKPVKGQLAYAPSAIERAVSLTARQPYLLQCLCESVFRAAKSTGVRSITIDHVNDAAMEVLKNRHFNDLFRYAGTERRRFILALCHRETDSPDALRLPVIREMLSAKGIEVSEEALAADLEWLTDLELLDFSGANGGDHYSLTIPLMGLWIDTLDYAGLMSKARAESEETETSEDE